MNESTTSKNMSVWNWNKSFTTKKPFMLYNFYTSYELLLSLLKNETHLLGTLRANKKGILHNLLEARLKREKLISSEDKMTWLSKMQ